jgi:trehalose 6-phosphate phosphatase
LTKPEAAEPGLTPRFAIFTDFDGTLIDLAPTPSEIIVPGDLPALMREAGECLHGALAVISGRPLAELESYLPDGIAIAGSHGTERRRADGSRIEANADWTATADRLAKRLDPLVQSHPALILELKPAAVGLHFRRAPELAELCVAALTEAVALDPSFEVLEGKMVVEARPRGTSKADAILAFMDEEPFAGRVPVFLGDDATDEDGFRATQAMGGVGVKVGAGDSVARVRTDSVDSARAVLIGLAQRVAATDAMQ